jgi:hypothetical protein
MTHSEENTSDEGRNHPNKSIRRRPRLSCARKTCKFEMMTCKWPNARRKYAIPLVSSLSSISATGAYLGEVCIDLNECKPAKETSRRPQKRFGSRRIMDELCNIVKDLPFQPCLCVRTAHGLLWLNRIIVFQTWTYPMKQA